MIACDSPGFGRSAPLPSGMEPTITSYADAFEWFMAELGLTRPHVAGNSMGGAIALELARRRAAASVTAFSPAGFWTGPERRFCQVSLAALAEMPGAARPAVERAARTRAGRIALFSQTFGYPARLPAEEAVATLRDAWASPAFAAVLKGFDGYSLRAPRGAAADPGDGRLGAARPAAALPAAGASCAVGDALGLAPDAGRRARAVLRRSRGVRGRGPRDHGARGGSYARGVRLLADAPRRRSNARGPVRAPILCAAVRAAASPPRPGSRTRPVAARPRAFDCARQLKSCTLAPVGRDVGEGSLSGESNGAVQGVDVVAAPPAELRAALTPAIPAIVDVAVEAICARQDGPGVSRRALERNVRLGLIDAVDRWFEPGRPDASDLHFALGRAQARAGRSLDELMGFYRLAGQTMWRHVARKGTEHGVRPEDLYRLAETGFGCVDEISTQAAAGFADEHSHRSGAAHSRRSEFVGLLLRDPQPPPEVLREAAVTAGVALAPRVALFTGPGEMYEQLARSARDQTVLAPHQGEFVGALFDPDGPDRRDRLRVAAERTGTRLALGPAVELARAAREPRARSRPALADARRSRGRRRARVR